MFDLDGTLVNSKLDFDLMRSELGILDRRPILEEIMAESCEERKQEMISVVERHEKEGAQQSILFEGCIDLINKIDQEGVSRGLLTRNSRLCTSLTLDKHDLSFELVLTREDVNLPKPDPEGLIMAMEFFKARPENSIYVGDFEIDILAAKNAGMRSIYIGDNHKYKSMADMAVGSLKEVQGLLFK